MKEKRHIETQITQVQAWQGPLPSPEALSKYNDAVPGAAERILSMAEKEMEHRHQKEDKAIKYSGRLMVFSTLLAFLCVIVLGGVLCYAIYVGSNTAAIATAIGTIAAVVGLFTFGKAKQSEK
jgi:uncharacterized membrane protein